MKSYYEEQVQSCCKKSIGISLIKIVLVFILLGLFHSIALKEATLNQVTRFEVPKIESRLQIEYRELKQELDKAEAERDSNRRVSQLELMTNTLYFTMHYKLIYLVVLILLPIYLLFQIGSIFKSLLHYINPKSYWSYSLLTNLGDSEEILKTIDREVNKADIVKIGKSTITERWLILYTKKGVICFPMSMVVWMYMRNKSILGNDKEDKHYDDSQYYAVFHLMNGKSYKILVKKEEKEHLYYQLKSRNPYMQTDFSYTKLARWIEEKSAIKKLWKGLKSYTSNILRELEEDLYMPIKNDEGTKAIRVRKEMLRHLSNESVILDGVPIDIENDIIHLNSTLYMPVSEVMQALGCDMNGSPQKGYKFTWQDKKIEIDTKRKEILVNGSLTILNYPLILEEEEDIYVPAEYAEKVLDHRYKVDIQMKIIEIDEKIEDNLMEEIPYILALVAPYYSYYRREPMFIGGSLRSKEQAIIYRAGLVEEWEIHQREDCFNEINELLKEASLENKAIKAYYLSLMILLCGECYIAGYLSYDEAVKNSLNAARRVQKEYGSWKEYLEYLVEGLGQDQGDSKLKDHVKSFLKTEENIYKHIDFYQELY